MAKAKNSQLVQVNMSPHTIKSVEKVQKRMHAANRSIAIQSSIEIAETVTKLLSEGGKLILQNAQGEKYLMSLPGIG